MNEGEVHVFVRKYDEDTRRINVPLIQTGRISQATYLERGFAIDGNQALMLVKLTELREVQRSLVTWIEEHGYSVEFR